MIFGVQKTTVLLPGDTLTMVGKFEGNNDAVHVGADPPGLIDFDIILLPSGPVVELIVVERFRETICAGKDISKAFDVRQVPQGLAEGRILEVNS